MRIAQGFRFAIGCGAVCVAMSSGAGTIFDAARFDTDTLQRDLSIRVFMDTRDARVDVSFKGHPQVSWIESGARLTLINHVAGIYVVNDAPSDDSLAALPVSSRAVSNRLFALGSYCPAIEVRWPGTAYQVQCSTEHVGAQETKENVGKRTKVGDFLRLTAATRDPQQLFEQAARILTGRSDEMKFPFVIQHFEAGKMQSELRMTAATENDIPRKTFEVPRGLRRMPFAAVIDRQATR